MLRTAVVTVSIAICSAAFAQNTPAPVWKFAVSGDSRNCGDVVVPAIASGVLQSGAAFYWHLGDFRAIYDFDEDMAPPAKLNLNFPHLTIAEYLTTAWPNFIDRQMHPFGSLEVFLGIGNHETIYPKTHADFIKQFDQYLDSPRLRAQRAQDQNRDKDKGGVQTYYHWVMNNASTGESIDFISLDNASASTFDPAQMAWIRKRLADDRNSRFIRTVVVGMHEAFPGSKGMSHSMCDTSPGVASGREVYELLWNLEQSGKKVYVLASHSHFVMDDVYNTPYWRNKVLPGWIVGTAGAVRYRLPPNVPTATIARTDVYGWLLATVMSDGSIQFEFKEVTPDDLRKANAGKTPESLIGWCVSENKNMDVPKPEACGVK